MNEKKKVILSFKDFYQGLDNTDKTEVRNQIIQQCGISYPTFYSKLNKGNYSGLEKREIERICGQQFHW